MAYTDEQRAYHRAVYQKRRDKIIEYLGGACSICGSSEDLEVDHVDPALKSFNISKRMSLSNIVAELDKCQLLCVDHHRAKTAVENAGFTHGTMYGWMKKKCSCSECSSAKEAWHEERNAKRRAKTASSGVRGPYKRRGAP